MGWTHDALSEALVLGVLGFVTLTLGELTYAVTTGRRRLRIWRH